MNNELLSKIDNLEKMIDNFKKEKSELEEKLYSEFDNESNEFYSSLISKCFYEKKYPHHLYLPFKYKGYDKKRCAFVMECKHLYYSKENITCNVIDVEFINLDTFKELYEITTKDKFFDSIKKAIEIFSH